MSKVIAVTGASGGVGRACVREFTRRGDSVALIARGDAGLEAATTEARRAGVSAIAIPVDVADPEDVDEAVARIEEALGPIDVWVSAAFTSVSPRSPRAIPVAGSTGRVHPLWGPSSPTRSHQGCWIAISRAPATRPSSPANLQTPKSRLTCGKRRTVPTATTSAPTAPLTSEQGREAGSRWSPTTTPRSRQLSHWVPPVPPALQIEAQYRPLA
ncbi:SDR family NAD(P)-dependent oxidoreductase [Pedococcus bigeumensis]|uniref:SDR family NAD(P)-dependent oxidoreductase n=1 Tax=Pedococcus bigeumensis TaxID=433644 RepID=UPI0019D574DF